MRTEVHSTAACRQTTVAWDKRRDRLAARPDLFAIGRIEGVQNRRRGFIAAGEGEDDTVDDHGLGRSLQGG